MDKEPSSARGAVALTIHRSHALGGLELLRWTRPTTPWRGASPSFVLCDVVSGALNVRTDPITWAHLRPGSICVVEPDAFFVAEPIDARFQMLFLPRDLVDAEAKRAGAAASTWMTVAIERSADLTTRLRTAAASIARRDEKATVEHTRALVRALVDVRSSSPRRWSTPEQRIVARAIAYMRANITDRLGLETLARASRSVSRFQLSRAFRVAVGIAPHEYLLVLRGSHARALISAGMTCAEAAQASGFTDQSHMNRHFRSVFGLTPGAWLAVARGRAPRALTRAASDRPAAWEGAQD